MPVDTATQYHNIQCTTYNTNADACMTTGATNATNAADFDFAHPYVNTHTHTHTLTNTEWEGDALERKMKN